MPKHPNVSAATVRSDLGELLLALNALAVLLTPFRTDNRGDGDAGCMAVDRDGSLREEGVALVRRAERAAEDVLQVIEKSTREWRPADFSDLMMEVRDLMGPMRWALSTVVCASGAADLLDSIGSTIRRVRDQVRDMWLEATETGGEAATT